MIETKVRNTSLLPLGATLLDETRVQLDGIVQRVLTYLDNGVTKVLRVPIDTLGEQATPASQVTTEDGEVITPTGVSDPKATICPRCATFWTGLLALVLILGIFGNRRGE